MRQKENAMSSLSVRMASAALSVALFASACSQPDVVGDPDPVPRIDWSDPSTRADLGDGWIAAGCEGGAPLLCIERNGTAVGTVELVSFPLESFTEVDPSRPVAENLDVIAAGFIEAMTADRSAGCGADYVLTPIEVASFTLGEEQAASFGYEGAWSDGRPSELNLQYGAIIDDSIVLIVAAAYDEGGCSGRDDTSGFDSATLAEFRPHLERLLSGNALPGEPIGA
ncbi:MAG: hypothetical protein R3324_00810 [Halobacteriales archaeon]|nr:hypothetical protein [Halobacteriales archaeon]